MTRLTEIWRHPIKAHGREALDTVELTPGRALPGDRVWAVAHEAAALDADLRAWASCRNFTRAAGSPGLMAIASHTDPASGRLSLSHPEAGVLEFDPDNAAEAERFVDWVRPLTATNRAAPVRLLSARDVSFTDSDYPSISLASHASRRAMAQKRGVDIDPRRFRINLWIDDDVAPWEELEWPGREITIGEARLEVVEPIERCTATHANPDTGRADFSTLDALEADWGHRNFGVNARVVGGGRISVGDAVGT